MKKSQKIYRGIVIVICVLGFGFVYVNYQYNQYMQARKEVMSQAIEIANQHHKHIGAFLRDQNALMSLQIDNAGLEALDSNELMVKLLLEPGSRKYKPETLPMRRAIIFHHGYFQWLTHPDDMQKVYENTKNSPSFCVALKEAVEINLMVHSYLYPSFKKVNNTFEAILQNEAARCKLDSQLNEWKIACADPFYSFKRVLKNNPGVLLAEKLHIQALKENNGKDVLMPKFKTVYTLMGLSLVMTAYSYLRVYDEQPAEANNIVTQAP